MQIISEVPKDCYLVKLTERELSNLLGYNSIYESNAKNTIKELIGNERKVPISQIFENALLFNNIKAAGSYDKAVTKLRKMVDALSPIDLIFETTVLAELEEKNNKNG